MFDYVAQFPIKDENAKLLDLQNEAEDCTRDMALRLGYGFAGVPVFEVLELPLSMYLQCRVPVEDVRFGGGRHAR